MNRRAIDATVVIPTHNPSERILIRVLESLKAQSLGPECWEVIIIDNCSERPVADFPLPQLLNLTIKRERKLGLTNARLAGIEEANGHIIVFLDDDNLPAADYLSQAVHFMGKHPEVGVLGGRIVGEFASPPRAWVRPHLGQLALRDLGQDLLISNHPRHQPLQTYDYFAPYGAGLVVQAAVAKSYKKSAAENHLLADRTGNHLGGCGDCEIVMRALLDGYQCAYSPALNLTHVIPPGRLRFKYLLRLARDGQYSWGNFCVRHGFAGGLTLFQARLRQAKAFFTKRGWTRAGFISWQRTCGYLEGLCRGTPPQLL